MQEKIEIIHPCGPIVVKRKMPKEIIDAFNHYADQIVENDNALVELDVQHILAGKLRHEFAIKEEMLLKHWDWFSDGIKAYLEYFSNKRPDAFPNSMYFVEPASCWVNSSYAGDYNPTHHHQGQCTMVGVGYLKVPDWDDEHKLEEQSGDGYAAAGHLELFHGQAEQFVSHQMRIKPEVGDFYIWPAGTLHAVWPFRSPGERRSIAINYKLSNMTKAMPPEDGIAE